MHERLIEEGIEIMEAVNASLGDSQKPFTVFQPLKEGKRKSFWMKMRCFYCREMHNLCPPKKNLRNVAVSLLQRIDQLWYKYIHMEEMLRNLRGARQIFERWMTWEPDHHGWAAYIMFKLRYNDIDWARSLYDRCVECHPGDKAWIRYAKFEMESGEIARASLNEAKS